MTVSELNRDQIIELKQNYLTQYFDECEDRGVSWRELAAADEIVPDSVIHENYGHYDFTDDDFFCSAEG